MFVFATTNYLTLSPEESMSSASNFTFPENQIDTDGTIHETSCLGWLPLVAIMFVAVGYHIGLSPITWAYTGKINFEVLSRGNKAIKPISNIISDTTSDCCKI